MMKGQTKTILTVVLCTGLLNYSYGGENQSNNTITYAEENYIMTAASLGHTIGDKAPSTHYMIIYNGEIKLGGNSITGTGNALELYINTLSGNKLQTGTYRYSKADKTPGTIPFATFYSDNLQVKDYIVEGTIRIIRNEDNYVINVELEVYNNEDATVYGMTGTYESTLSQWEN